MAASGPSSPDTTKEMPDSTANMTASKAAKSAEAAPAAAKSDEGTRSSSDGAPEPEPKKSSTKMTMPTYLTTKQSKAYTLSKQLLAAGSLDDALSTLEVALQFSREMLTNSLSDASDENEIELHESLAPLYYLYGTTLLYSVEESDVMMASGTGTSGAGGEEKQEVEVGDIQVEVPPETETNDNHADGNENENQGSPEEEDDDAPPAADTAEDLQIAWENLDLARSIVSHLAQDFHPQSESSNLNPIKLKSTLSKSHTNYNPEQQSDLLLDLAQIHTRLADLQRGNANILSCIDDYNHALKLRTATLGKFDKKVADSHFSLAAVYAEAPNRVGENEGKVEQFVSQLGGAGGSASHGASTNSTMDGESEVVLSEDDKMEMRRKSLEHYLACGVVFAGLMAQMCGEDADKFCQEILDDETSIIESTTNVAVAAAASAAASASAASTNNTPNSSSAAKSLAKLRHKLAQLEPPSSKLVAEEYNDLKEMMDEIQEAMDTADETEEGLKSLGEMKANEMKKHEMKQNDNNEDGEGFVETSADGAMTTIGFGKPSSSAVAAAATTSANTAVNAFGASASTAAAASGNNAPTMMVVKKKKKKIQPTQVAVGGDKESDAKRLKTN